jgi:hypothetical protein
MEQRWKGDGGGMAEVKANIVFKGADSPFFTKFFTMNMLSVPKREEKILKNCKFGLRMFCLTSFFKKVILEPQLPMFLRDEMFRDQCHGTQKETKSISSYQL